MNDLNIFVDESGCPSLFNKNGSINLNKSQYFLIGYIEINNENLIKAKNKFDNLRKFILSDIDLCNLESVKKSSQYIFHACKDDHRIRNLVFTMLENINYKCYTVIRRKEELIKKYYNNQNEKFSINFLYQDTLKRLFDVRGFNKYDNIIFSKRTDIATNQFYKSLNEVQEKISNRFLNKKFHTRNIKIYDSSLLNIKNNYNNFVDVDKLYYTGLEMIDYTLWALHRGIQNNDFFYCKILERNKIFQLIRLSDNDLIYSEHYLDYKKLHQFTDKYKISENWYNIIEKQG